MTAVFEGVRVIEVAEWTFAPAAGAVLAEFGADVLKVERAGGGDPQRALVSGGVVPSFDGVNVNHEQTNRGKQSITLDLKSAEGRQILGELVAGADVFLTNYLPQARTGLRIDVDDIRADNDRIVYAIGSAYGSEGPEAGVGGYDAATYWARGGIASAVSQDTSRRPPERPGAFGDRIGSMNLAFGIAAALYQRAVTGQAPVVETSLLATALWQNASSVAYSLAGNAEFRRGDRPTTNPIVYAYETADGRWIQLVMQESERYWGELCANLGRPDLATNPRFLDARLRAEHCEECTAELRTTFATRTADEWRARLAHNRGPWAVVQTALEAGNDPQAAANGYVQEVTFDGDRRARFVSAPVVFDRSPARLRRAPELGEHTEKTLLDLGRSWDQIAGLRDSGVI